MLAKVGILTDIFIIFVLAPGKYSGARTVFNFTNIYFL